MRDYGRILIVLGVVVAAVALAGATTAAGPGTSSAPEVTKAKTKAPAAKRAAAQPRKAKAKKAANDTGVSTSQPANANDITTYWTPDRMKNAEPAPMGARQGGAAAKPTPTGKAAGGAPSAQARSQKKAKSQKKSSRVQTPADVSVSTSQQVNAADVTGYWTPERMKDAQPAPMGVPGGSSGAPPTSGDTAGGSAP
jgi:hypothetical protein